MHFSMRDWTICSASSILFFTHAIPLTLPWKIKHYFIRNKVLLHWRKIKHYFIRNKVTSLTKKMEKMRIESKKQKISLIFSINFFCSSECKPKQKYWKRKINHPQVFVFIFYLQNISSLSSFQTKIEIKLRNRKIITMFLSIKKSLLYPPE